MSSTSRFRFEQGNLEKLLALPKYVLALVLSWFVPRVKTRWVFGSGVGVGEGALAVARELARREPTTPIVWLTATEIEAEQARGEGFTPVARQSWTGFWATLRAGQIVVTHGLGDVNRFGAQGGFITQLWHGAPLKKLHFDSPVTTVVRGPAIVRRVLRRMYARGANSVDLYVAGSSLAATRLRSAFRVDPGKVRVLGDPRDDALAAQVIDPDLAAAARAELIARLGTKVSAQQKIVLYAPTWRDGAGDPVLPEAAERAAIERALAAADAHLVIRSHPLGEGEWADWHSERVHLLGSDRARDITPLLGGVDWLITDYSSIAIDFALMQRPIVWFAPDLAHYTAVRGLYEPLEVTSFGRVVYDWSALAAKLSELTTSLAARRSAVSDARALAARFHAHPEGGAAGRVLDQIEQLQRPARELVQAPAAFFESFYGRQVSCNPLALDREIAARVPQVTRYWSVTSETQQVPEGAVPLLVGGREWHAARRYAKLIVANDWLRYGFRRARGQIVLQTWHGTMLKHLALGRPKVGLRTRIAIKRESQRWSLLLSQNPHATEQFRSSYAFRGRIIEAGYPRCDRLATATIGHERNPVAVSVARASLGVRSGENVLVYAPTWRDGGVTLVDDLNVAALARELGAGWVVLARGHTRTQAFGVYGAYGDGDGDGDGAGAYGGGGRVIDVSTHPDINDVLIAADLVVTDYSSIMFDASVAWLPLVFFAPDLAAYRDRERGFTFDFEREAPGPIATSRAEVLEAAGQIRQLGGAAWLEPYADRYGAWREKFNPHDDGAAAARVVDELQQLGALSL